MHFGDIGHKQIMDYVRLGGFQFLRGNGPSAPVTSQANKQAHI